MNYLYYLEINKSKFYGYCFFVENKQDFLNNFNEIKKQHKKATHFIYVYQYYENNSLIFKRTDDIEPKGYATNSIVQLINKNNLSNIAFVIIRYYGGVKLGGSKLVQTYQKVTNNTYKNWLNNKYFY